MSGLASANVHQLLIVCGYVYVCVRVCACVCACDTLPRRDTRESSISDMTILSTKWGLTSAKVPP